MNKIFILIFVLSLLVVGKTASQDKVINLSNDTDTPVNLVSQNYVSLSEVIFVVSSFDGFDSVSFDYSLFNSTAIINHVQRSKCFSLLNRG